MFDPSGPIGVLAIQGDYAAHCRVVEEAGFRAMEIRCAPGVEGLSALVLPGGESTTMLKFLESEGLDRSIRQFAGAGGPILATCAGVILLAKEVTNPSQASLGLLDVKVKRIGYGRQVHSAIHTLEGPPVLGRMEGVFIRAPKIMGLGKGVQVLSRLGDDPVLVRQGRLVGATFHPELSRGSRVHAWFLEEVAAIR